MAKSSKKTAVVVAATTAQTTLEGAEPETLTAPGAAAADAPAAAAAPKKKGKATAPKPNAGLNSLAEHLANGDGPQPVKVAILHLYQGEWDTERELSVLKLIKADDRFVLTGANGINMVGLAGAVNAAAPTADAALAAEQPAAPAAEPVKTIAEHVADAQARPTRVTWPVDIGSSVLLLTDGQPPRKVQIRNIHNGTGLATYDLITDNGGTIDGVLPDRIGRDLDAEGELAVMRAHILVLEHHQKQGKEIAQKHIEMQATEKRLAETLSKHRKAMDEVAAQLAEHARAEPGQQDLREVVGDGSPSRGEKMASEPSAAEDKLADAPADAAAPTKTGDWTLEDVDLQMEDLEAARVEQATASTGKPQKIVPVGLPIDPDSDFRSPYALVDVQNGRAVLVPVFAKDEWKSSGMQKTHGKPMALPSDTPTEALALGGRWCGFPVKVGRATCWLGSEGAAVLIVLPPKQHGDEPAPAAVGKDAAAGD